MNPLLDADNASTPVDDAGWPITDFDSPGTVVETGGTVVETGGVGGGLAAGGAPGAAGTIATGQGGAAVGGKDAGADTSGGGAVGLGGVTGAGGTAKGSGGSSGTFMKLTGTPFGTGPAYGNNPIYAFDKAFDGSLTTYVDDQTVTGGYTGIELVAPATVTTIRYYPRSTKNHRMIGGKFQCSATSQTSGYNDLYTIAAEPPLAWVQVDFAPGGPTCRYVRYLGPANGYTNVAEVEFWGVRSGAGGGVLADAGAPLTNLSFNKPVMASSQVLKGEEAIKANDGLLTSQFCPVDLTVSPWWLVDLGAVYPIVQADINFASTTLFYKYRIDVSSDGTLWATAVDQSGNTTRSGGTITDALTGQARFVRITVVGVSSATDVGCLLEFMVWGYDRPVSGANTLTNLSLGKLATAITEGSTKPASRGNDGVMATSFCPGSATFPVWWKVDLGAVRTVRRTDVSFEQQTSIYTYTIDVSQNDTTWTRVVDQSANTTRFGAVLTDTFTATAARYVRITISDVSTPDQGCFWEFTVWGS